MDQTVTLEEARAILKRAVELEPNSGEVRWELARAYQQSGEGTRAGAALRDAIKLKPELQGRLLE